MHVEHHVFRYMRSCISSNIAAHRNLTRWLSITGRTGSLQQVLFVCGIQLVIAARAVGMSSYEHNQLKRKRHEHDGDDDDEDEDEEDNDEA